jgi:subtilisin family serine protease
MAIEAPPWRRERQRHFPGLPAWSAPATVTRSQQFEVSALPQVDRRWAWEGADGSGVRVCVVDSGIDATHPMVGEVEQSWHVVTDDLGAPHVTECEPIDGAGHGTSCAGIIRSVAPGVRLSSVRVLTDGKAGSGGALLAGLEHAIDAGFDLVNMSLSTTRPQFRARLAELADRAYFRRCVLVVSAHNMPVESFPWTFSSVISVSSHDQADPLTYFYNPAPPADFHARGARVPVARLGGGVMRGTGNSFAAPHITGIAALILSRHPWLTPFQLKSVLYHCAANVGADPVPVSLA